MPKFKRRGVILKSVPPGLLNGLPDEDVIAIQAVVGKHVRLVGYNEFGQAELEFRYDNACHTIWVAPDHIA